MRQKRWIAGFLTLCLLFSGLPVTTASAAGFTDIQGHWAYDSIIRMTDAGVFQGVSATKFEPNTAITRAAFVTILARYDGYNAAAYKNSKFKDVPADSWYGPAVAWAYQKGIVSGVSNTAFAPNQSLTRESLAVILVNYANYAGKALPRVRKGKLFSDSKRCADYALDAIYTLYRSGIINGTSATAFSPKGKATRADCAQLLCNYQDIAQRSYTGAEKVQIISHRGYSWGAPENTLPAFELSAKMGCTYVEADVRFTKDGVPVLLHDATIDRTSNGSGEVSKMTYSQLQQYDFGAWMSSEYAGTKLPTFEQFIALCAQKGLRPYIELKSSMTEAQVRQLYDVTAKYSMSSKVIWISTSLANLKHVLTCNKSASLGLLDEQITQTTVTHAKSLQNGKDTVFISAKYNNLSAAERALCLRSNLTYGVWTIDTAATAIREINSGAQFITTNSLLWSNLY
ncbi:MAG: S-layer homology domain-containing protein [Eubacteriales bacterium]|nr:S-layer homology domain-containing protein [Eubacteriales bacterium]